MLFTLFDGAVTLVIYLYRRLLVPALAIATLMSIVAAAQWSTPDDVSTSEDSWGTGREEESPVAPSPYTPELTDTLGCHIANTGVRGNT